VIHALFLSERAVLRWAMLCLVGAALYATGRWFDLPTLARAGRWAMVPFALILGVALLVLAPSVWWHERRARHPK